MELRTDHPLDIDLMGYALGSSDDSRAADISDHLDVCLLCRIRLARIRRSGLQPEAALPGVAPREVSPTILSTLSSARRPGSITPGQVWLAGSVQRMLVWVRAALDSAVNVYAMTLDIEAADDTTLIIDEFEAIGHPVAIMCSVVGTVPNEQLSVYLGDLNVQADLERISASASSDLAVGLTTGAPITSQADERIEFRQILADELASLDPIEEDDDELDSPSGIDAILDNLHTGLRPLRGDLLSVHPPESFVHLLTTPLGCTPVARVEELGCSAIVMASEDASAWPPDDGTVAHAADFLAAAHADALALTSFDHPFDAVLFDKRDLHDAYEPPRANVVCGPRIDRESEPLTKALLGFFEQSAFASDTSPGSSPPVVAFDLAPLLRKHAVNAMDTLRTQGAQLTKREALRALSSDDATAIANALVSSEGAEDLIAQVDAIAGQ